jgi:catechol 2,3-dioxygenase-like lactoylglutathione lyase family enzyme
MRYEAIDHVVLAAADVNATARTLAKLGLHSVMPPSFLGGVDHRRCVFLGGSRLFHLQIVSPGVAGLYAATVRRAAEAGRGLCAVALRVHDLDGTIAELRSKGIAATTFAAASPDGEERATFARLEIEDAAGVPLWLCRYSTDEDGRLAEVEGEDGFNHTLPVKRLDHLAAVARNLEAQTHFWTHTLGVPLFGEVVAPTMIVRQFKIGDAIIELLGPNGPDSLIHTRPPGLISMMSLEVPDLAEAVAQARAAGFTPPDPAKGVLPSTIFATVPATETGGVALQMLQYA